MSRRAQPIDIHEMQLGLMKEELDEEDGRGHAARVDIARGPNSAIHAISRGAPRASRAAPGRSNGYPPNGHSSNGYSSNGHVANGRTSNGQNGRPPSGVVRREGYVSGGPNGPANEDYSHEPSAEVRNERGKGLDVKELLKQEAFESLQSACDDHFEKNRPCPQGPWGVSDQYIVLDSFNKVPDFSNPAEGVFKWNFNVQGSTDNQAVGVRDRIDTVTEIQIGRFSLPIFPEVPYVLKAAPAVTPSGLNQLVLVHNNNNAVAPNNPLLLSTQYPIELTTHSPWINNPYSQIPYGDRLTIQLKEVGLQAYTDIGGAHHHFEMVVAYAADLIGTNPNMVWATPMNGTAWDIFELTEPLFDVHGLTLVFRNPDIPVSFQPDVLYQTTVDSDAAALPGPYLEFTYVNHGLSVGDRIYIKGYASGISTLDTYVNRPQGHVVSGNPAAAALAPGTLLANAVAPGPYADSFWLDPAVSIVDFSPAPTAQIVDVYVAKRRIRIPMRLRRIVDRVTNYIAP
jgi:hypothetical protein